MKKLDWRSDNNSNYHKALEAVRCLYEEYTVVSKDEPRGMNNTDISIYTDVDRYEVASDSQGYVWFTKHHNDEIDHRIVTCSLSKLLSKIYDIDKIVRDSASM